MHLTTQQFDDLLGENQLVLSLIGMSNIGKTHWSKKLKKHGFEHISCDDIVEEKLAPELVAKGYKGLADMAKWMGQPYEDHSPANQQAYLDHEIAVMQEIFANLPKPTNTIIDTTGSVIYTGPDHHDNLNQKTLIVYLRAPETMKEDMFKNYIENPKPVLWGESFNQQDNESTDDALARCYPELLDFRTNLYEKYANITIDFHEIYKQNLSAQDFLNLIKQKL